MIFTLFVLVVLIVVGLGLGVTYAGLLASSFLFNWPDPLTWKHTLAAWVVLVIVSGVVRSARKD